MVFLRDPFYPICCSICISMICLDLKQESFYTLTIWSTFTKEFCSIIQDTHQGFNTFYQLLVRNGVCFPALLNFDICFHLNHREANRELEVKLGDVVMKHDSEPRYLVITLDRTLTYKANLNNFSAKLSSRNNLVQKVAHTSWGAKAQCLRTTSIAFVYSCAEYCALVWLNTSHTKKVDVQLNKTMRTISGILYRQHLQYGFQY